MIRNKLRVMPEIDMNDNSSLLTNAFCFILLNTIQNTRKVGTDMAIPIEKK
jgi:hypothetical protein